MKLIDFDELEKLKDSDDANQIEEDWDGGFFEEFADKVSEDIEEDDEEYLAIPKEMLESEHEDTKDLDEENYIGIPTELKEQYAKEVRQRELKAKAEEEHFVVEKEEEDIYELSEETESIPLEEKRIRFGRMLGLRAFEETEIEEPEENQQEEELEEILEEAVEEIADDISDGEALSVELPDVDFEAMADEMTEELLKQQEQETENKEPVYYNPFEFDDETNEEYEKFRENYVKRHILHEEEIEEEPATESKSEIEEESVTESESATENELEIEDVSEEISVRSDETISEELSEGVGETMFAEMSLEEDNDGLMENDTEAEEDTEETSSFVDEQEFYRIEQEELRRIQGETEEIEDEEIEDEETDVEFDEPEVMEDEEDNIEDTEYDKPEVKEVSEETVEIEAVVSEETQEASIEEPVQNEEADKKVLNIRDLPTSVSTSQTVSEGVLQKRTLPNRQEKPVEEQPVKEVIEQKEEPEKNFAKTRAALGLSQGKKIRKLQSAFEDEYLDVMDYDIFERKGKRKRKKSHKRKDFRQNKIDWEEEDETPDKPFKEFFSLMISIVIVVVVTFVLVEFVGQRTEVNGESMESTLHDGDNLIVDKITYAFEEPQRFDIVVFPYKMVNSDEEVFYIKRIIGLPGERVQIINGFIYINGELLVESYGKNNNLILNPGRAEREIQLAEDEYFVLGDNRNNSSDSREIGNIKKDDIVGRAWLRMWPLSDFGILKHQ